MRRIATEERRYADTRILFGSKGDPDDPADDIGPSFNSYDSMDKFVFVIDFQPSIDTKEMFNMNWGNGMSANSYNILSDAGCIPHFAYQSLVKYADKDGGIAYTWNNKYLENRDHLQFELLGLDDKAVPKVYDEMQRMIVEDVTDDCKTLLCPTKFMDDIYRIWCETMDVKTNMYLEDYKDYENHFPNEYKDYPNPELDFGDANVVEHHFDELFELDFLSDEELELTQEEIEQIDNDGNLTEDEREERKSELRE